MLFDSWKRAYAMQEVSNLWSAWFMVGWAHVACTISMLPTLGAFVSCPKRISSTHSCWRLDFFGLRFVMLSVDGRLMRSLGRWRNVYGFLHNSLDSGGKQSCKLHQKLSSIPSGILTLVWLESCSKFFWTFLFVVSNSHLPLSDFLRGF